YPGLATVPIHIGLGIIAGVLGVAYTRAILGTLSFTDRLQRWPGELRALSVGAAVGLLAWFAPGLVGGGDAITQRTLDGTGPLSMVALVFAVRFALGPVSYGAGVPGGLFAPMLVLGAQTGVMFGSFCEGWIPSATSSPT